MVQWGERLNSKVIQNHGVTPCGSIFQEYRAFNPTLQLIFGCKIDHCRIEKASIGKKPGIICAVLIVIRMKKTWVYTPSTTQLSHGTILNSGGNKSADPLGK